MRILITGFEPFGKEAVNPSGLMIEEINAGRVQVPETVDLRGLTLPVTFIGAPRRAIDEVRVFDPDVILAFGLAAGRDSIVFERVAINLMDAEIPDNEGFQPREVPIDPSGSVAFFASLPIRTLSEKLKEKGLPSRISNTAGLYVCNALFYRLLRDSDKRRQIGFIHVPRISETASAGPELTLSQLVRALEVMLTALSASVKP